MKATKPHLLLLALYLVLCFSFTSAFTVPHLSSFARGATELSKLPALIYMPDGEVIHDDEGDQRVVREGSTAILEYLNAPDFRGALAVLAAAHGDVDIQTIQHIQTIDVTKSTIHIEALCAADETNCVNIRVNVDFPVVCKDESEIIQNLNTLHEEASAMLEKKKLEKNQQEELNVRPVAPAEKQVTVERQIKLEELKAKRESYNKQRALLAARLEIEAKIRALRKEDEARRTAEARELARLRFKEEMELAAEAKRKARFAAQEEARLAFEAKRESHAKQRALLAARLEREARTRLLVGDKQEQSKTNQSTTVREYATEQLDEEKLDERYEAIADIGERAFTILVDLGMVSITPDPQSPDYDSSQDDEFVQ